jgi:hypothetical protein
MVAAMLGGGTPSKKGKDKDTKGGDPMVAAMLGGGTPSKRDKAKDAKGSDPMVAAMLGGGTQAKKESKMESKPVVPAPIAPPLVPVKSIAPQVPDRIRKIKALLMISKRVRIENMREALSLDAETCDIVLNIWKNELGIDVTSDFADFKDIETDKIVNIVEAFLAEWNKPQDIDGKV